MQLLGPLAYATLLCHDLDSSTSFYKDLLGYVEIDFAAERMAISAGLPWEPARDVVLGCPGERLGFVRFVGDKRVVPASPLTVRGWSTLEFIVSDVEAIAAHAQALGNIVVITEPSRAGAHGNLGVFHVLGPSGEIVYLTQILRRHDRYALPPTPSRLVGRLFIAVWSTPTLEQDRDWVEGRFAVQRVSDRPARLRAVNWCHDRPADVEYRISSLSTGGGSLIEMDEIDGLSAGRAVSVDGISVNDSARSGIHAVTFTAGARSGRARSMVSVTSNLEVQQHD